MFTASIRLVVVASTAGASLWLCGCGGSGSGSGPGSTTSPPVITSTTLAISPTPVNQGTPETLTATVTSTNGTPTGTVTFYNNGTSIGTGSLNGSGVATLNFTFATAGAVSLSASYPGDAGHSASTSSIDAVTVNGIAPVISSFAASTNSLTAGQPVTLSWNVLYAGTVSVDGVSAGATSPVTLYPAATTTYTLTATNGIGTTTSSQTITVNAGTQIATATVGGTAGQLVPADFMGLGIGSTSFENVFGEPSTGTNTVLRQLIRNLTQYGAAPITYKITADATYPTSTYVPTPADISALTQLYSDLGVTYFVGVNLAADSVSTAVSQADAFASNMPAGSLIGMEIGNEPDEYAGSEQYRTAPYYFLQDYANFAPAVLSALQTYQPATVKLIGPVWGRPATLTGGTSSIVNNSGNPIDLNNFLTAQSSNLSFVSQHGYADQCINGASYNNDFLLSASAQDCVSSSYLLAGVAPAHAQGLKYRIDETNSITGGGVDGISNTFQAALWIMDWSAGLAQGGVDGINIFGDSATQYYTMFTFNTATTGGQNSYTLNYVTPQYYGVLMFQQATQNGAQFLPVTLSALGNQVVYAWKDAAATIRVLVLNKGETGTGTVAITLPSGYGAGTVTRLLVQTPNATPAYLSTNGVTLGGQTFDTSTDGTLQGTAYSETALPSAGTYTIAMPVTSAVLLTVPQS